MAAFPFPSSWSSCPPKDLTEPKMAVRNFQRAQLYFHSVFRPRTNSLLAHCGCERPIKIWCPIFYLAEGNGDSTHSGESRSWYPHVQHKPLCSRNRGVTCTRKMLIALLICPILHVAIFTIAITAQMRICASIGIGLAANGYYLK